MVTAVENGSIASEAGIQQGDIILEVDKKDVTNVEDYNAALDGVKGGGTALFLVQRGNNTIYVALRFPESKDEGEKEKG